MEQEETHGYHHGRDNCSQEENSLRGEFHFSLSPIRSRFDQHKAIAPLRLSYTNIEGGGENDGEIASEQLHFSWGSSLFPVLRPMISFQYRYRKFRSTRAAGNDFFGSCRLITAILTGTFCSAGLEVVYPSHLKLQYIAPKPNNYNIPQPTSRYAVFLIM